MLTRNKGWLVGDAEVVVVRDLSALYQVDGEEQPRWVPHQVLHQDGTWYARKQPEKGDVGTLTVAYWWAKKTGLTR